jgi:hypothetical protein
MQSASRRKNCRRNVPAVSGNREENPYFIVLYAISSKRARIFVACCMRAVFVASQYQKIALQRVASA